jgi:hypothetical protein
MGNPRPVNVTVEKFVVGYFVYYVIYIVLLFLLLAYYTPRDAWIWFFLVQATFVAIVIIIQQLAPDFVEINARVPIFMAVKPVGLLTEALHLVGLGMVTNHYGNEDAAFWWIFPTLVLMQTLKYASLGFVRVSFGRTSGTRDGDDSNIVTTYSIPIAAHLRDSLNTWRRAQTVKDAM